MQSQTSFNDTVLNSTPLRGPPTYPWDKTCQKADPAKGSLSLLGLQLQPAKQPAKQPPQRLKVSARLSQSTTGSGAPVFALPSTSAANTVVTGHGKMKRVRFRARVSSKRQEPDEAPETLDLPIISLPIGNFTLPRFSFTSTSTSTLAASSCTSSVMVAAGQEEETTEVVVSLTPEQQVVFPSAASVSGNRSMSFRSSVTPRGASRALLKAIAETPAKQPPQRLKVSPRLSQSTTGSGAPVLTLSSKPTVNIVIYGRGKMKRVRFRARLFPM